MRIVSCIRRIPLIVFLSCLSFVSFSQQVESSYFLDNYAFRHDLNPAFRPTNGYFTIPGLGNYNLSLNTNALTFDKIIYPYGEENKLVTFLYPSVDANTFLNSLSRVNTQDLNIQANVFSFGFFSGKSFWSFDVNLRSDVDCSIPKDLFEAMKLGVDNASGRTFNITNLRFDGRSYVEAALGYSRPVNDRLTLGGKLKFLVGFEDFDAYFKNMQIQMSSDTWKVTASGRFDVSMKGLTPKDSYDEKFNKTYISGFNYNSPEIGGYGGAVDLGATYKLTNHLTLSVAALDLGLIKWAQKATISGVTNGEYVFNGFNLSYENSNMPKINSQLDGIKDSLLNLAHYTQTEAAQRTTYLHSTFKVGAEYAVCHGKLSMGLLSTTRFGYSNPYMEMTSSVNMKPCRWISGSLTYSWIHSDFKTFGFAFNFTPAWFLNMFVATDYMLMKVNPQYIPINQRAVDLQFGFTVPLASNRYKN